MVKTGSQKEYAAHRGCSEAYVSKLKKAGKIVFAGKGLIDFEATDQLLLTASDPTKLGVAERWAAQRGGGVMPGDEVGAGVASSDGRIAATDPEGDDLPAGGAPAGVNRELYEDHLRARVRSARLEGDRRELELLEQAGELVRARDVEERIFAYGREIRDLFMGLPARVQADLAAETDPVAVGKRLDEEIKVMLHELSRRVVTQPRARREAGEIQPA